MADIIFSFTSFAPFENDWHNLLIYFLLTIFKWLIESSDILQERCSSIIYNEKQSSFSELLEKDGSVPIHMRNIQYLAIQMFRVSRNILLPIMYVIFKQNDRSWYNWDKFLSFEDRCCSQYSTEAKKFLF